MKCSYKCAVAIIMMLSSSFSYGGCEFNIHAWGEGCGELSRAGAKIKQFANDPLNTTVNEVGRWQEQAADVWKRVDRGLEYYAEICANIGLDKCSNPSVTALFNIIQEGKLRGVYNNTASCVSVSFSLSEMGTQAAQIISAAEGVPIPTQLLSLSENIIKPNVVAICEALFHERFMENDIVMLEKGLYAEKSKSDEYMQETNKLISSIENIGDKQQAIRNNNQLNQSGKENQERIHALDKKLDEMNEMLKEREQQERISERRKTNSQLIEGYMSSRRDSSGDQRQYYDSRSQHQENQGGQKEFYLNKAEDAKKKVEAERLF